MGHVIFLSTLIALWYWLASIDTPGGWMFQDLFIMGAVIGAMYGDVKQGLILGATIQMAYLGVVAVGSNLPSDKKMAGLIAIPLAFEAGLDPGQALAIAVPFGLLGAVFNNAKRTINGVFYRNSELAIEDMDINRIYRNAYLYPMIMEFFLYSIPVFAIMFVFLSGGNAVAIIDAIPEWLMNSLSLLGGTLPAVGILACVRLLGQKKLLPYFFIGFLVVAVIPMGTFTFAVIAACIAIIIAISMPEESVTGAHNVKEQS